MTLTQGLATMTKEMKDEVKPDGVPDGFISFKEFAEKYPNFKRDYLNEVKMESPMKIWINEECDTYVQVRKVAFKEDPSGKIDPETKEVYKYKVFPEEIEMLSPKTEYDIDIVNFVRMFGDPYLRFDLDKKPLYMDKMKPKRWQGLKAYTNEICRRELKRQPVQKTVYDDNGEGKIINLKSSYTEGSYEEKNTTLGLWGKAVKVWVLPPDQFEMTVRGTTKQMAIEDYAWEAMQTTGMKMDKNLNAANEKTKDEILAVKEILVGKELIKPTASIPYVRSIMGAAQDEYKEPEQEKGD